MDSGNGDGNGMGNGDDDGDGSGNETGDGDGSTPTDADEPTPTATEEPGGETATPPSDPDQRVAVGDGLRFDPESFEISVGDTVLWEWVGSGHNISYDDGAVPSGTDWEGDDEDIYGEGHTHSFTFETAGEYDYYCVPHRSSGMTGSFTVTE